MPERGAAAGQGVERIGAAHFGAAVAVDELQVLGHEFDIADRAFAQLDLAPLAAASAELGFNAHLEFVYPGAHILVAQGKDAWRQVA